MENRSDKIEPVADHIEKPFDTQKFMDGEWARLAAFYGVSVEEVKSKEFDEKIEREDKELREKIMRIDKKENEDIWRKILCGGIMAGAAASFVWFALSSHRWWFPIPGVIIAACFCGFEDATIKQIQRQDYPNAPEKYWKRVNDALVYQQVMSATIAFIVFIFILFATR